MIVAAVVMALYFVALGGGVFLLRRARRANYGRPVCYRSTEVPAHRIPLPGTRKHEAA